MKINIAKLNCEICRSDRIERVLDLGMHPLCDDLIPFGDPTVCEDFRIEISLCRECVTCHHIHQVPKRRLFPASYHYRSRMTEDVLCGMKNLVDEVKSQYGSLQGKLVFDIGCNDGSLLKLFAIEGARIFGLEPTAAALDAQNAGIPVINDFLDLAAARNFVKEFGCPDFITFTNVFAHIENIDDLLDSVAILMGSKGRLVVENHYLGAVLEKCQFDTFYHEHPRTYSLNSFVAIARRLGRNIENYAFPSRYGGNIRVIIGPGDLAGSPMDVVLTREQGFYADFSFMRHVICHWMNSRQKLLDKVRSIDGKIYAKAFPGRAAVIIRLLDLTERDIGAVFENPRSKKIGHFVPGTRIPILSDDEMLRMVPEPRRLLNLAWHIHSEIEKYLVSLDPAIHCIDVFSPSNYEIR
jgi:SAM-dependent methyltransferase